MTPADPVATSDPVSMSDTVRCTPTRRSHLVLLQGGRARAPEPFVVAPPAVRAAMAASASTSTSRSVRMAEADLTRCRSFRPLAR
jgi:hypothetical protein